MRAMRGRRTIKEWVADHLVVVFGLYALFWFVLFPMLMGECG